MNALQTTGLELPHQGFPPDKYRTEHDRLDDGTTSCEWKFDAGQASGKGGGLTIEGENIRVFRVKKSEAMAMVMQGKNESAAPMLAFGDQGRR